MTTYLYTNFAASTLQAAVTAAATSMIISAADASKFPVITTEHFYMTVWDRVSSPEIVEVTARVGQVLTVIRGVDGTAGTAWLAGTPCRVAINKALLDSIRASSLTTNIVAPANGQFLKYSAGLWINAAITEADVVNLVADLLTLTTGLATHTHTAAQVAGGNPKFTTVYGDTPVILANGTDLNGVADAGWFRVSGPTNGPAAGNWLIESVEYDGSSGYQKGVEVTGAQNQEWIRRKAGGVWGAWISLPTDTTQAAAILAAIAGISTFADAGGTVDAITADFTPDVALSNGVKVFVRCGVGANTSAAPTLSTDATTARTIFSQSGAALWPGAINGDHVFEYVAAGPSWRVMNPNPLTFLTTISPASISTKQNDWAPTGFSTAATPHILINVALSGSTGLTGLLNMAAGTLVTIKNNNSDYLLWLENMNTASAATKRFRLPKGFPAFLMPMDSITLIHNGSEWEVFQWANQGQGMGFPFLEDALGNRGSAASEATCGILATYSAGTGAFTSTSTNGLDTTEKALGVMTLDMGTTNTGRAGIGQSTNSSAKTITPTLGPALSMGRVARTTANSGTETYTLVSGFRDGGSTGTISEGVAWECRWTGAVEEWSHTRWVGAAATRSNVGSPAVDATFIWTLVFMNANWSRADFIYSTDSVNFILAESVTTGLPGSANLTSWQPASCIKTVGTTSRTCSFDIGGFRMDYVRG